MPGTRLLCVAFDQLGPFVQPGLGDVRAPGRCFRRIVLERKDATAQVTDACRRARGSSSRGTRRSRGPRNPPEARPGRRGTARLSARRRGSARPPAGRVHVRRRPRLGDVRARPGPGRRAWPDLERGVDLPLHLCANETGREMVVDDPARLHGGVHRGRADEAEAGTFELLRERGRLGRGRSHLLEALRCRAPPLRPVAPHELVERRPDFAQRKCPARVRDRRLDLAAMPDDAGVLQQPRDVPRRRISPRPRDRTRRRRSGSSRACGGSSATRAPTGSLRGKTVRAGRARR